MSDRTPTLQPGVVPPPSKHQLGLMIWLCVFPTLTVINITLDDWLQTFSPVLRTFVLATIAVPIVIYGLMPHLHRLRARLMKTRQARRSDVQASDGGRVLKCRPRARAGRPSRGRGISQCSWRSTRLRELGLRERIRTRTGCLHRDHR